MTTNVFHGPSGIASADTRWSIRQGNWLFYTDEPIYPKIVLSNGHAFVFAGFGEVIQSWKDWIVSGPSDFNSRPASKGMSVCIVSASTGKTIYKERQDIRDEENDVFLAGSGALAAYECLKRNGCAKRAVLTASSEDVMTGSDVHFFETSTGHHNFSKVIGTADLRIEDVSRIIAKRGNVMNVAKGDAPFKLSSVVTGGQDTSESFREVQGALARGELLPEAPCSSMHNAWSADDEAELNKALAQVFGITA